MNQRFLWRVVCGLSVAAGLHVATAADWPQWRGPGGLGVAQDKDVPLTWDAQTGLAWKINLPGPGASSPVVFGDRIYLTCYTGYGHDDTGEKSDLLYHVLCFDRRDGQLRWDKTVKPVAEVPTYKAERRFIREHGYASATPAVDATGVYVVFGAGEVSAWTHDGQLRWQKAAGAEIYWWGSGSSPVLAGDHVLVVDSGDNGALVALHKTTGATVWRQEGIAMAWSTPLVLPGPPAAVVVSAKGAVKAFDPVTGKSLWAAPGIKDYICPSPVAQAGVVYAIGGRTPKALALQAGTVLWQTNKANNVSSPVYHDGHLFWAHDRTATFYCVNAKTGALVYEEKQPGKGFYASPVAVAGRLYYVARDGTTFVLAAQPQFAILARNQLAGDDTLFNASPAVSNGQLFLRSNRSLYCIGGVLSGRAAEPDRTGRDACAPGPKNIKTAARASLPSRSRLAEADPCLDSGRPGPGSESLGRPAPRSQPGRAPPGGRWSLSAKDRQHQNGGAVPDLPLDEALPREPVELYGLTKALGERMCRYYSARHELSTIVLRPGGIRPAAKYAPADPGYLFGAVDVRDVAQAHRLALELPATVRHEVFIITADSPLARVSAAEYQADPAAALARVCPQAGPVQLPATAEWYTITKARRKLGYQLCYNFQPW